MEFVGDSPLLAFHAPFDSHMLGRALKDYLGYRLQHAFLDVADLAPMLCPQAHLRKAGLDDWIDWCKLQVFDRHNASDDALAKIGRAHVGNPVANEQLVCRLLLEK